MVTIEINGKQIQVRKGAMVIEAADEAGITIPRFCYHRKLSVAANCRMCLVEVEKVAKPLPACATPVTDGMKVFTHSAMALEAQKSVMEFLLINHPLDCPICDQGGECILQDLAVGYGKDVSRYHEEKRVVADRDIGPLIATEMTRCIHCTRCVRFGQEIAGIMELGATGRGEHTRIGTYVQRAVSSEMSGNVIDLCPVGALTSKPYRYTGRPWENQSHDAIAAHDCVGSSINIETRRNRVMRVLPRENESVNEIWISDRDRYSYLALDGKDRALTPMIKQGASWKEVDWQTALNYAVEGIKTVINKDGSDQLGALLSPSSTVEEMYLLQRLLRDLGSSNIDHRLRQLDHTDQANDPVVPALGQSFTELEEVDAALLIGSWMRKDQPLASHRLRKAAMKGAAVMSLSCMDYEFNFPLQESLVTSPAGMLDSLLAISKALLNLSGKSAPEGLDRRLENVSASDAHLDMAKHLHNAEKATVLLGVQAMSQNEFADLRALAGLIADLSAAKLAYLPDGSNSVGAWLSGCVPHRGVAGVATAAGKNVSQMCSDSPNAMLLLNMEPEYDTAFAAQALKAMQDAHFVVSMTPFVSESVKQFADVILPIAPFSETSGTYVNATGQWQSFTASVPASGESRPAWKVLRVLGNLFALNDFDYMSSEQVRDELAEKCAGVQLDNRSAWRCPAGSQVVAADSFMRIGHLPLYALDNIVRRSSALQHTEDAIPCALYLNASTAASAGVDSDGKAKVEQGEFSAELRVVIDEAIPDGCVMIPQAMQGSENLGPAYGEVKLTAIGY